MRAGSGVSLNWLKLERELSSFDASSEGQGSHTNKGGF